MWENLDIKSANRVKIMKYLIDHNKASRQELAHELNFSMPTLFQIVNDLIDLGLICESGEYGSTGGRRAKILTLCPNSYYVAGVGVSKNHIQLILMDLSKEIISSRYLTVPFEDTIGYYEQFGTIVGDFLKDNQINNENSNRLLGVGISLPGTLDLENGVIKSSYTLGINNVSFKNFSHQIPQPVHFSKNSIDSAFAEVADKNENIIYLSLNDTVGGGAYLNQKVYLGDHFKAMVLGHIIIVAGGRQCYCGKRGCLNAYCSARTLCEDSNMSLDVFFDALKQGNRSCDMLWDSYLEHLAVGIANLRAIFDCKIILGGKISPYLTEHINRLSQKVLKHSIYEHDASFITLGKYHQEVFAVGAAKMLLERCIEEGEMLID